MNYIGEHLFPGQLGHFCAVLSLISSLVASISYFKATRLSDPVQKKSWLKFARTFFLIETVAVFTIFFLIYFIMSHHYHEYYYAWNHSSRSLPPEYLFASFWEGQEGSFMLWNMWHCILGWVFITTTKKWEAPVMAVVSLVQFGVATMLIGIYFFSAKIGSNPFALFREQMPNLPLFNNPNYLSLPRIHEGNDLNALLQNYWMVIHPPILFLGFASTVIPFGFAFGGLLTKDHTWTKASLPWAAFSAAALGTGIMMGAAWAYESLTFGGYWAWDPVENASLVPWLVLVAGLHTNLIYRHSGYALKSTYIFYIFSFSLVLYSTFLTRSGILGDTSVHAFTGADMTTQLITFCLVFFVPAIVLFFMRSKDIPTIKKEESTYSREFWMFIGSLVLFLSAIIITAKTSVPVYNKLFNTNVAMPEDAEFSYNQIQIFIAIILGLLTAFTQYLKYKNTPSKAFWKSLLLPTAIALVISLCISIFGNIDYTKKGVGYLGAIHLAIFAAVYGVVANAMYIWSAMKGKLSRSGASIAHVGFALALVGILISSSKKTLLSENTTGINLFEKNKEQDPMENITLFKDVKTDMGKYDVTYAGEGFNDVDHKTYFNINFQSKKDSAEAFSLHPDWIKNNKGQDGNSANPDKKHYWNRDVFVYVSAWQKGITDDSPYRVVEMKPGDTTYFSNGLIILNKVDVNPPGFKRKAEPGEVMMVLDMTMISKDAKEYKVTPAVALQNNSLRSLPDTVIAQGVAIRFNKMASGTKDELELGIKEDKGMSEVLTLKVFEFPFINILWLGIVIMVVGLIMSIIFRVKQNRLKAV